MTLPKWKSLLFFSVPFKHFLVHINVLWNVKFELLFVLSFCGNVLLFPQIRTIKRYSTCGNRLLLLLLLSDFIIAHHEALTDTYKSISHPLIALLVDLLGLHAGNTFIPFIVVNDISQHHNIVCARIQHTHKYYQQTHLGLCMNKRMLLLWIEEASA